MRFLRRWSGVTSLALGLSCPALGCGNGPHPGTLFLPFTAAQIAARPPAPAPTAAMVAGFAGFVVAILFLGICLRRAGRGA